MGGIVQGKRSQLPSSSPFIPIVLKTVVYTSKERQNVFIFCPIIQDDNNGGSAMRRISVLMAFLITGYILGIWNFLVLPRYYIVFGMKGFLISLIPLLTAVFLAYEEAESTKKTRYLVYELFFKIARMPAVIFSLMMFLLIMLGITTYYTSYSIRYIFGLGEAYVPVIAVLTILLATFLLVLAKGRTLEFISGLSILMIIFTIISTILVRDQALAAVTSEQARYYMNQAVSAITSLNSQLSGQGLVMLIVSIVIAFGLGAGVYYVIGSFAPEDLDFKKVLIGVFFLQLVLSLAAAYTMAYSLGPAFQAFEKSVHNPNISPEESFRLYTQFQALRSYTTNSTTPVQASIKVFYLIPEILKRVPGAEKIVYLLISSLYFAGLTTIIVLIEMGSQMFSEVMQINRGKSLTVVSIIAMFVVVAMMVREVQLMFLAVPFGVGALMAALEAYPLLPSEVSTNKWLVGLVTLLLALASIIAMYYLFARGVLSVRIGIILGLVLFVPVLMNGVLLRGRR